MKRWVNGKLLLLLGLVMVLAVTGCSGKSPEQGSKELTLNIGEVDAVSGPGAVYGSPQHDAIQMAVKEINDKGGVKVGGKTYKLNLVFYDDKADATEALSAVRKLIDRDGVKFIVGWGTSASTMAVVKAIGSEDAVMLVGTAAERSITSSGLPNVFRTRPPAGYTGVAAGKFIASQGKKKVAVIGQLKDAIYFQYYEQTKKAYLNGGGTIIAEETFNTGDRDMYPQLTKIINMNPDALFVTGYVEQVAFVYRQARELGYKGQIYGFSGGSEEQFLKVVTSEAMEGNYDLRPVELTVEALGPNAQKFVDNYKKMFNKSPTPNAPYAYDCVYVLKDALEKAGTVSDTKKVIEALKGLKAPQEAVLKYMPVKGGGMFDENGQAFTSNVAMQWKSGKWTYAKELESDVAGYSQQLKELKGK